MENPLEFDERSSIRNSDHAEYAKSFEKFINLGNEKEIIFKKIVRLTKPNKYKSLLDIGGGRGDITLPLSRLVGSTLVIEPNALFAKEFLERNIPCLNTTWEETQVKTSSFDIIIATFVISHFPKENLKQMIDKMISALQPDGDLIITAVDAEMGTWRDLHTILYQSLNISRKTSSANTLKEIMASHGAKQESIKTYFEARRRSQIIEALKFDFLQYRDEFKAQKPMLLNYLQQKKKNGVYLISDFFDFYHFKKEPPQP